MEKQFEFTSDELENKLKGFKQQGITELTVHDQLLAKDKARLIKFLKAVRSDAPELFVSIKISPQIIDMEVVRALSCINCSVEMDFVQTVKGFDKKLYARKCALLNQAALVFGVNLYFAEVPEAKGEGCALEEKSASGPFGKKKGSNCSGGKGAGGAGSTASDSKALIVNGAGKNASSAAFSQDSLKAFKDRLDFTIAQYPNHIDFPQIEEKQEKSASSANISLSSLPSASASFSAQDIRFARDIAFACRTFYSAGRAVPWFNSILMLLRIQASAFFADFAEWQRVNNCDFKSGYLPEEESHENIEKMQILFLDMKLEEKRKGQALQAVNDIVRLNGAFSRLVSDGQETVIETEYNPDDLLSPESMDILSFANDVCMCPCRVQIFINSDGEPDYRLV
ncbi:MAG: hypothetical protein K6E78_07805 [Treponema sp.]|nr:hypothetical protein [Treponema sp.]